jgi:hypothetical protein
MIAPDFEDAENIKDARRITPALAGCGKTQRDVDGAQHSNPNRYSIESFLRHRPRI